MVGTEIGNYRIIEKIGSGGMGVVYKAVDTQLDRVVAVKALNPELSGNPALLERFRGEARAQAQLNHPNLATLYAFLVVDDAAYMVMEFVDGETLHQMVLRNGPIASSEAVPLFRQALAGIGCAHRAGIIHRDIKPSNIMLNREGIVKVMDFGLAKVTGDHGVTKTGVRLGTAYYMSPEQILMKKVDVRSDIYSLGATLYEVLTGRAPFHADSEFEILNDHVNTDPPPLTRLHPQIPSGVEHAVLKALAKNPDQRFQSAEQFSAALEHPEEFYLAATAMDEAPVVVEQRIQETPPATVAAAVVPTFWTGIRILAAAVVLFFAVLAIAWLVLRPKPQPSAVAQAPVPPSAAAPLPASPPKASPFVETTPTAPEVKPVPAEPARIVIAAATAISVRTVDPIDAKASEPGQEFVAKLTAPVKADGKDAFHIDDEAHLRLGETASDGHSGKSDSILELVSVTSGGQNYAVTSAPFLIKGGFLRKKKVAPGTKIEFTLKAPVSVKGQ